MELGDNFVIFLDDGRRIKDVAGDSAYRTRLYTI